LVGNSVKRRARNVKAVPPPGHTIDFQTPLKQATFIERLNRFAAIVELDGGRAMVHVANTGRMSELLVPENPMYVTPIANSTHRKTAYDLTIVELNGVLVSVDSRLPNRLMREAVEAGQLAEFAEYGEVTPEVTFHESRIDLLLSGTPGKLYLEAKSVNLVVDGTALFPDAPSERGRKHLGSLMKAVDEGYGAAVAFVIQRPDAERFSPHRDADPAFTETLQEAAKYGVRVYAYRCDVSLTGITVSDRVPVGFSE